MLLLSNLAFEAACARWDEVADRSDETTAFAPLAECLWWAVSVDERYDEIEGTTYRQRRDGDSDGRLLPGIWWARHRLGHDQAMAIRAHAGAELDRFVLDVSRLDTITELVWCDVDQLPAGRSQFGRDVYEKRLQGRRVADAVVAVRRWFAGGARFSGPLALGPP